MYNNDRKRGGEGLAVYNIEKEGGGGVCVDELPSNIIINLPLIPFTKLIPGRSTHWCDGRMIANIMPSLWWGDTTTTEEVGDNPAPVRMIRLLP